MAAMPASPQPVVFTISPGQQGTCTRPLWSAANTPSPPRLMNTRRRPVASRASAAALRLAASVMDTPESSSASSRLGLRVWSFPSTGRSFSALAVDTGSAKMGRRIFSASQAMDWAGMLVSTTRSWAFWSSRARPARKAGVTCS